MRKMSMPLSDMKVVDLTRLLPGPFCTHVLADLGANVIRVEDPVSGDYLRMQPPLCKSGMSIHFHVINRNKKSIAIDLKRIQGRELLLELACWADVLVEQFRPGVMERLGLGYETVREVNPAIIYCSITGYGQDGPYKDFAGHDINYLSYAGVVSITGRKGEPPGISGVQIADVGAGGLFGAFSILAAYIHRLKTGEGQHLDVSMLDGSVSWLTVNTGEVLLGGKPPERGTMFLQGGLPCYNVYEAKDGYIAVGALEEKFWRRLCEILGKPEYAAEQFNVEKHDEIFQWLEDTFKQKTRAEWMEIFQNEDACVSPVLDLAEVCSDPQVLYRNMIVDIDDEKAGKIKTIGIPVKFSLTPGSMRQSAPYLGEHTVEVLRMINCSQEEIDKLLNEGVVYQHSAL